MHELLKREAFAAADPASDDHFEKGRPSPAAPYGASDQYVVLDSWAKAAGSAPAQGVFRWNMLPQGDSGDDVVGTPDRVDTVVFLQLGAFAFPLLPEAPYALAPITAGAQQVALTHNNANLVGHSPEVPADVPLQPKKQYSASGPFPEDSMGNAYIPYSPWGNNPYAQLPFLNRFTVEVREAGRQAFSDRKGARHHFEFAAATTVSGGGNPYGATAVPIGGSAWDTYVLTDPLPEVHGLTLVFRGPDAPLAFAPDVFAEARLTVGAAVLPPVPPPPATTGFLLVRVPGHDLLQGDRIFFRGAATGYPAVDAALNRPEGWTAAGSPAAVQTPGTKIALTGADADGFYTDPAISVAGIPGAAAALAAAPPVVAVYVAKRRMRIPMRMRRIVGRLTHYSA